MIVDISTNDLAEHIRASDSVIRSVAIIKGTNGTGKTEFVNRILGANQGDIIHVWDNSINKIALTLVPDLGICTIGKYHGVTCGGCDNLRLKEYIISAARVAWNLDYDLIMEGMFASKTRYYNGLFQTFNDELDTRRQLTAVFLYCDMDLCMDRIYRRNGKHAKRDSVEANHRSYVKQLPEYEAMPDWNVLHYDTTKGFGYIGEFARYLRRVRDGKA